MAEAEIQISRVESRADLDRFIRFPWQIYENHPMWVPPLLSFMKTFLNREKNPFFKHSEAAYFLARRGKRYVGRIAAILNENHNRFHRENIGFFGFFEAIDDEAVFRALISEAEAFARERGATALRGPASFSTNDECGLLVEGFDGPPLIMMPYNPPYYATGLEACGFQKAKDLYAYKITSRHEIPRKIIRVAELIRKKTGVELRHLDKSRFWKEIEIFKDIYNHAWEKNWGFVPMTDDEFHFMAKELKAIIDPEIIFIATVDQEPAGFSLCVPDINLVLRKMNGRLFPFGFLHFLWSFKKIRQMRLMGLGIKPEFLKRGIDALFYLETWSTGLKKGYEFAELSWLLEDNQVMNQTLVNMGAEVYRIYRLYEKPIAP